MTMSVISFFLSLSLFFFFLSVVFCYFSFLLFFFSFFVSVGAFFSAGSKPMSYEEVFGQSSSTNCTVYCGNLAQGSTEEALQKIFGPYGQIQEIRVFKDKGYAFIRWGPQASKWTTILFFPRTLTNVFLFCFLAQIRVERVGHASHRLGPQHRPQRSKCQMLLGQGARRAG